MDAIGVDNDHNRKSKHYGRSPSVSDDSAASSRYARPPPDCKPLDREAVTLPERGGANPRPAGLLNREETTTRGDVLLNRTNHPAHVPTRPTARRHKPATLITRTITIIAIAVAATASTTSRFPPLRNIVPGADDPQPTMLANNATTKDLLREVKLGSQPRQLIRAVATRIAEIEAADPSAATLVDRRLIYNGALRCEKASLAVCTPALLDTVMVSDGLNAASYPRELVYAAHRLGAEGVTADSVAACRTAYCMRPGPRSTTINNVSHVQLSALADVIFDGLEDAEQLRARMLRGHNEVTMDHDGFAPAWDEDENDEGDAQRDADEAMRLLVAAKPKPPPDAGVIRPPALPPVSNELVAGAIGDKITYDHPLVQHVATGRTYDDLVAEYGAIGVKLELPKKRYTEEERTKVHRPDDPAPAAQGAARAIAVALVNEHERYDSELLAFVEQHDAALRRGVDYVARLDQYAAGVDKITSDLREMQARKARTHGKHGGASADESSLSNYEHANSAAARVAGNTALLARTVMRVAEWRRTANEVIGSNDNEFPPPLISLDQMHVNAGTATAEVIRSLGVIDSVVNEVIPTSGPLCNAYKIRLRDTLIGYQQGVLESALAIVPLPIVKLMALVMALNAIADTVTEEQLRARIVEVPAVTHGIPELSDLHNQLQKYQQDCKDHGLGPNAHSVITKIGALFDHVNWAACAGLSNAYKEKIKAFYNALLQVPVNDSDYWSEDLLEGVISDMGDEAAAIFAYRSRQRARADAAKDTEPPTSVNALSIGSPPTGGAIGQADNASHDKPTAATGGGRGAPVRGGRGGGRRGGRDGRGGRGSARAANAGAPRENYPALHNPDAIRAEICMNVIRPGVPRHGRVVPCGMANDNVCQYAFHPWDADDMRNNPAAVATFWDRVQNYKDSVQLADERAIALGLEYNYLSDPLKRANPDFPQPDGAAKERPAPATPRSKKDPKKKPPDARAPSPSAAKPTARKAARAADDTATDEGRFKGVPTTAIMGFFEAELGAVYPPERAAKITADTLTHDDAGQRASMISYLLHRDHEKGV